MSELNEILNQKHELPDGALDELVRKVIEEYSPDGEMPGPVVECPNRIVRIPAFTTNLAGHDVLWQGATLVVDGEIVRLRYDDGRVAACLADAEAVEEMIADFYRNGEVWR